MKRILLSIALAFVCLAIYAIPAKPIKKTIVVDGKSVVVTFRGDENCHFWLAEDGKKYTLNNDGSYKMLSEKTIADRLASPRKAHPITKAFFEDLASPQKRAMRKAKFHGEKRGLVILVNFQDDKFVTENAKEYYTGTFGTENYKDSKHYGSLRDYFKAQSYGKFDYILDVAGPVTLSHNVSYYGENDEDDFDSRPGTMVYEACKLIDDEIDFSKYDWDGDGEVEQIFVLHAGYDEAEYAPESKIWSHQWYLKEAAEYESGIGSLNFDGVKVNAYATSAELQGSSGKNLAGIGTACHEFSHCFGLPDLYCTDYNHEVMAMALWSLMDHGNNLNDGFTPCSYTAYERWVCGWIEPTVLNSPQYVTNLGNIDETGDAYIIYNDGNKNEYYVLYNVQQTGWNSKLYGHGMLVLHVDYDEEAWTENTVNNDKSHLRLTPICADNKRGEYSITDLAGDPYPGYSNNTSLTDESKPAAALFNANKDGRKYMGKPITEIAEKDGVISFTFMGGINAPEGLSADYEAGQINASWTPAEAAGVTYNIKYGVYDESNKKNTTVVDEDFSKLTSKSDGTSDVSSKLDDYLNTKGCSGSKLYSGKSGMKMSSSKTAGELILPALEGCTGTAKIVVGSKEYSSSEACTITVAVYEKGATKPYFTKSSCPVGEEITVDLELRDNSVISIQPTKRCYLSKLTVEALAGNAYGEPVLLTGISAIPYTFTPAVAAEKYWMQVQAVTADGSTSSWSEIFVLDASTTSIKSLDYQVVKSQDTYNLNGQKVGSDYRGIIIKNGRKVVR